MTIVATTAVDSPTAGEISWSLLPDFLIRSTGFPFEWLDGLRMERSVACAAALVEGEALVARLREEFDGDLFARCLQREQQRGHGTNAFRPWYVASRLVRRLLAWPPQLAAELGARDAEAADWCWRWSRALEQLAAAAAGLDAAYETELVEVRTRLREIALEPRFQEAVLLSSPEVYSIGLASYLRRFDARSRPSKMRHLEGRLYAYVQRFCTKNDTTSFFGPIDYGRFDRDASAALELRRAPGGSPVRRLTRLSYWAADALAATISGEADVQAHLVPRLADGCRLLGFGALAAPGRAAISLSATDAALLRAVDGIRTAREVCDAAGGVALSRLLRLRDAKAVRLRVEIATSVIDPLLALRAAVAALPTDVSARWLPRLDVLAGELGAFSAADAPQQLARLERIESRFGAATGVEARRGQGRAYADRLVLYDEAQGDIGSCVAGASLRDDLLLRLAPALDVCAWYSTLIQDACQRRARDLLRAHDDEPQAYLDFVTELEQTVSLEDCLQDPTVAGYRARLEQLARARERDRAIRLSEEDVASLRVDVPAGTLVSPDIFLAARDPEAIARGDYELVVGEVHYGSQVHCHFLALHPDRERIGSWLADAAPSLPAGELRAGFVHGRSQGKTFYLEPAGIAIEVLGRSLKPSHEVLGVADIEVVAQAGGVALRSRRLGAILRAHPGDPRAVSNWLWGTPPVIAPAIVLGAVTPRIEIGRAVVARARWELDAEQAHGVLAGQRGAALLTAALRLLAEHGLPSQCFVRVATERKPFFVDFANLFALEQLVTLLAGGGRAVLTEVLPRPDRWWLHGPGTRSNEWRMTLIANPPAC